MRTTHSTHQLVLLSLFLKQHGCPEWFVLTCFPKLLTYSKLNPSLIHLIKSTLFVFFYLMASLITSFLEAASRSFLLRSSVFTFIISLNMDVDKFLKCFYLKIFLSISRQVLSQLLTIDSLLLA